MELTSFVQGFARNMSSAAGNSGNGNSSSGQSGSA
jgi:hypothetical protein